MPAELMACDIPRARRRWQFVPRQSDFVSPRLCFCTHDQICANVGDSPAASWLQMRPWAVVSHSAGLELEFVSEHRVHMQNSPPELFPRHRQHHDSPILSTQCYTASCGHVRSRNHCARMHRQFHHVAAQLRHWKRSQPGRVGVYTMISCKITAA